MIVTRSLISLFFLVYPFSRVFTQVNSCSVENTVFQSGEEVRYRAFYNWGFIWLKAGDVVFRVNDTLYNGKNAFHLISSGWSLKEYDWFYKVRDRFESIVDKESLTPYWFERDTYEGSFKTYNRYLYNYSNNLVDIVSYTSKRAFRQEALPFKACTFDVLSAIYFCRNIDFNFLPVGEKIPLSMVVDNEIFQLYIRFLGRENLTLHDGRNFNTIKFSVLLVEGTIFKGGEDLFVWVTDDKNRIPVLIEAKILIGSVKAVLSSTSGLRN